jgi:hypothetical protein
MPRNAGYRVAANYARGAQVAQSFEKQTGVRALQWDVAGGEGCRAGVARVKDELGAVDILATDAGITLDRASHKMSDSEWFCGCLPGSPVSSRVSPSTPSVMKRACHLHTPGFDLPERRLISAVRQPSAVARMIGPRHVLLRRAAIRDDRLSR